MRRTSSIIAAAALLLPAAAGAQPAPAAPQTLKLSSMQIRGYQNLQRNLAEAAEKMPEADYSFKPTPDVRPFGQLVAHVAFSQFGTCATLRGEAATAPHKGEKEDAARSKAQLVALLKDSTAYCDPALTSLKDEDLTVFLTAGESQVAKGLYLTAINNHGNEVYGTMAVYLRLKGIVPPSTERQNAAKKTQ